MIGRALLQCLIRQVVGSVGHQQGTCSCYGGDVHDPPGVTVREAARAAAALDGATLANASTP